MLDAATWVHPYNSDNVMTFAFQGRGRECVLGLFCSTFAVEAGLACPPETVREKHARPVRQENRLFRIILCWASVSSFLPKDLVAVRKGKSGEDQQLSCFALAFLFAFFVRRRRIAGIHLLYLQAGGRSRRRPTKVAETTPLLGL